MGEHRKLCELLCRAFYAQRDAGYIEALSEVLQLDRIVKGKLEAIENGCDSFSVIERIRYTIENICQSYRKYGISNFYYKFKSTI